MLCAFSAEETSGKTSSPTSQTDEHLKVNFPSLYLKVYYCKDVQMSTVNVGNSSQRLSPYLASKVLYFLIYLFLPAIIIIILIIKSINKFHSPSTLHFERTKKQ